MIQVINGRTGVFDLLDETCIIPRGDDLVFRNKCVIMHKTNPKFKFKAQDRTTFTLVHYAGDVLYELSDVWARMKIIYVIICKKYYLLPVTLY